MADKLFTKDPVRTGDPKRPLVIVLTVLVLLGAQFALRFLFLRPSQDKLPEFIQDPNRAIFKEEDIARGLANFGAGAKDSLLAKFRMKEKSFQEPGEFRRDKLAPLQILAREKMETGEVTSPLAEPEKIGLPLGTKISAILKDKVFSFNVENHLEAEVTRDVFYLGKLRIPKGTRFFGTVSLLHSEDRVNIYFHRVLLPDGEERTVRAVAHSLDGSGGIKGKVHRHWFKKFFQVTGKTALSALTLFTVPNRQDAFSLDDQLRLTAGSNLAQEAQRGIDSVKTDKSITVENFIPITIVTLETI